MFFSRAFVAPLLVALLLLAAAPLQAATEAERLIKEDIDRREQALRERRWDELHPAPDAAPSAPIEAPADAAEPAGEDARGPCFLIREISLQPQDILSARRVRTIIAPWRGRCLHAGDLSALQQALNRQAMAEGLVTTRIVVPEQNLASGVLRFEVWPGRVEGLRAPAMSARELAWASPLEAGDLLNLRALEQTVDNINRLASRQAKVELVPGEKPGGSLADFSLVSTRPWQAGLSWQGAALNAAQSSHMLRASVTIDRPLQLSDRLLLGVHANLKDQQVDNAYGSSVDYDMPVGWWRLAVGADRFDYGNPVTAGLTTFQASGVSRSFRSEISRLMYRDARHRFSLALHDKQRVSENFVDSVMVGVSSTRVHATGLRADFSRILAPWVWDVSLDVEGGSGHSPALISPLDEHYSRVMANTRLQYQTAHMILSGRLNGQWSDARLAPSEQFTLTEHVAGFAPQTLNAATAASATLEAAFPQTLNAAGFGVVRPALGFSAAVAPKAAGNVAEAYVAACYVGVTTSWKQAVVNVKVDFPLEKFSVINAADDWQVNAGVGVQW